VRLVASVPQFHCLTLPSGPTIRVVTLDSNACPADPEAVAEAYIMGTLSKDQATTFEEHKS
jgi:hypothetical protein